MKPLDNVIGMTAVYRRLYQDKMQKSEVVASHKLVNSAGEESTLLTVANGDEVFMDACHFVVSTASASD